MLLFFVFDYLYQGQSYDRETGLAYNRFRYYDPEQGNYISQDPIGLAGGNPTLYGYVGDSTGWLDVFGLNISNPFQRATFGELSSPPEGYQRHELLRHKFLQDRGLANNRLSGNPAINLDLNYHRRKPQLLSDGTMTRGGAHYHENLIRATYGLKPNQFHTSIKRELDITQGALRKAGIVASEARKMRKDAQKFYNKLIQEKKNKNNYGTEK